MRSCTLTASGLQQTDHRNAKRGPST
ncbi:hypothetical protein R2601_03948 [Salipiger bermudensis HTCC2601]|uniref:Uncharacterized protein n=1 Tax=Salipiger bermudensis (strain DSM 26914 / JCM 13377 / KCTC 12554 / HTCC2601) TaxID=314265 RepID=Q0FW56_SALBH|nr:hypothetical protein R2601_03948 [Salipiger bermudensis HTCC2601]